MTEIGLEMELSEDERFLTARFAAPYRLLSWAPWRGGFSESTRVVWHYVRRQELPRGRDPKTLLRDRLDARGLGDAVGLLTARTLASYRKVDRARAGIQASTVATVGLGNALRVGDPADLEGAAGLGTINILVALSVPLTDNGLLEALSLAAEARTLAVLDAALPSPKTGRLSSGTGTDCIVVACPLGQSAREYAGKHTVVGELVGQTVATAVEQGCRSWKRERLGTDPKRGP